MRLRHTLRHSRHCKSWCQAFRMTLAEMTHPTACNTGCKSNPKGQRLGMVKGGFKISLSTIIGSMDGGTYDSGGKNEKKQTTEGGVFGRSINFAQRQNQSFYPSHLLFLSILVASCLWMAWNSRHTLLMELFPSLCRWTKMNA